MSAFENPVLLVIYRRPELTRRVFDAIAKARPKRLFIAADGPATSAEREACDLARQPFGRSIGTVGPAPLQ
jgi:hypothetical protein